MVEIYWTETPGKKKSKAKQVYKIDTSNVIHLVIHVIEYKYVSTQVEIHL